MIRAVTRNRKDIGCDFKKSSNFDVVDSSVQALGHAYRDKKDFTGAWEQFWLDAHSCHHE